MDADLATFRRNLITTISVNIPGKIEVDQWIKFAKDRGAANMAKIASPDSNTTFLIQLRSTQTAYDTYKELKEDPDLVKNKIAIRLVDLGNYDFDEYIKRIVGKYAQLQT